MLHGHNSVLELLRGGAAWWLFSALVQALEPPDEKSGKLYRFLFRFVHLLGANFRQVMGR